MVKKSKKIAVEEKAIEASSDQDEKSISEEDLETSGLSDLLDKGKDQGFLTYQDINSMLPEDISDPDQVEETIQMLMDIGIEVIESVQGAGEDNSDAAPETIADTRTTLTTVESEVGRTTDPVRLYMREMGTVDLLTREGEIAIAKRIEEGARELLFACCFYPGIVDRILDDYQLVVAEDKRLSEVMVGFMDIEEGIPPPAMAQKKEKEDSDEEEQTGPDPVEVKKRFSALKRQFNKAEKACVKSRRSKTALVEQEKLGEIFKFLKLSPTQFEIIANPARDALEIIRECEKFIFTILVKRGKMPRKEFVNSFSGNESDSSWCETIARSRNSHSRTAEGGRVGGRARPQWGTRRAFRRIRGPPRATRYASHGRGALQRGRGRDRRGGHGYREVPGLSAAGRALGAGKRRAHRALHEYDQPAGTARGQGSSARAVVDR